MSTSSRPVTGILKGATIFFIASLLTYVIRFATSIIVARTLGPDGKGVYVLVITLGAFLALFFNFGLNSAITYLTASKTFQEKELFSFAVIAAALWGVVGILIFIPIYNFVLSNSLLSNVNPNYVYLVVGVFPINLLISFITSILLGRQFLLQYNLVEVIRIFSNLALQIVSALAGWGLTGAIFAWAIANLIACGFALWFTRSFFSARVELARRIFKPAFAYGSKSYIANLLTFFNYRLDTFLVNFFSGVAAVGLYSTGVSMAELLYYLPNAISGALFPKVPTITPEAASQLTARLCRIVLLVTIPLCIVFGVIGILLIPWIFGAPFKPSISPFLLLLPGIIGISVSKLIAADLSGRGKPQYAMYISIFTVIMTISLDILLIPRASINGAAIASTSAYLASALLYIIWFSKETSLPWNLIITPERGDFVILYSKSRELLRNTRLIIREKYNRST
jgi:O-antigen/teichoic acid export membrane protein